MAKQVTEAELIANWVGNVGDACTSAAVLTALGALGGTDLPDLADASARISGRGPYQEPGFWDYVGAWSLRRAPIDSRIEALAASCGLKVRSTTRIAVIPSMALPWPQSRFKMPGPGEVLIGNMAYGQEGPGQWGTWGLDLSHPSTVASFGHSVVIAGPNGKGWDVVDSNHAGIQHWPRPGWAGTSTRIQLLD